MGSSCENSAIKKTKNPHDLSRVPGGSSGGSAAAVAADETILALGSDTGGSIRQPSAYCGIVGLKPTYGAVSRYGLVAFASSLDQIGPMTKTVADASLLYDVIAGRDENDATSRQCSVKNTFANLKKGVKGMKIGLPKEFFGDGIEESVKKSVMEGARALEKDGAILKEISLSLSKYALSTYYIVSSAEASSNLARFDGIKYGYRTEEFSNLEELYEKTRSEGFGDEVKRRILLGTYVLSSGYYDAYYKKGQIARKLISKEYESVLSDVDVILTPTVPTTAFKIGGIQDPVTMYLNDICTVSINIASLPAISVPCGADENNLPIGMQLIGKRFSEQTLLNSAYTFENLVGREFQKASI